MHKNRLIALMLAFLLIVVALAISSGNSANEAFQTALNVLVTFANQVYMSAALYLIVGTFCYALTRDSRIIWLTLIWATLNVIVYTLPSLLSYHLRNDWHSPLIQALRVGQTLVRASSFVPFVLLFASHFQGRWERLRIISLILIPSTLALDVLFALVANLLPNIAWVSVLFLVAVVLGLCAQMAAVFLAAWCLAFRRAAPHRPPADVSKTLSLPCPRCRNPMTITLPHGECLHCRLQLNIALEEGTCTKCHRPLRGLTGDKCPECGTPFVQSPDPTS
jgi:hypothetical protein